MNDPLEPIPEETENDELRTRLREKLTISAMPHSCVAKRLRMHPASFSRVLSGQSRPRGGKRWWASAEHAIKAELRDRARRLGMSL